MECLCNQKNIRTSNIHYSKECNVVLNNKVRPPTRSEILAGVHNKDAILCTVSDKIDLKVLDSAGSSLKVISSYSTGIDHIDIEEASKRGIHVTTTGNILTEAVVHLTFALILAISRHIVHGHEMVTRKRWKFGWIQIFYWVEMFMIDYRNFGFG